VLAVNAASQETFEHYFPMSYLYSKPKEEVSAEAAAFETWLQQQAESGSAPASFLLGYLYAAQSGDSEKNREAAQWLQKAAEQGNAQAQLNLGALYQRGVRNIDEISEDMADAHRWYAAAAEAGLPEAQYTLGIQFYNGVGTESDMVQAYHWITLAAEHQWPEASETLASISTDLSSEQLEEAAQLTQTWKADHSK
jgi:TPR repeat protein